MIERFSVSITQGSILRNLVQIGPVVSEDMLFKEIVDRRTDIRTTTDGEWSQKLNLSLRLRELRILNLHLYEV